MKTRHHFTRPLHAQLAATAALAPALARPSTVLVLPPELSGFQSFVNKVHRLAGDRTPVLVGIIDRCPSREAARAEFERATLKQRRDAARHLGLDTRERGQLYIALLDRVTAHLRA